MKYRFSNEAFYFFLIMIPASFIPFLIPLFHSVVLYDLLLVPMLGMVTIYLGRRKVFTRILIDDNGVESKMFKQVIFKANWNEINRIGTFKLSFGYRGTNEYIVFSKWDNPFPDNRIQNLDKLNSKERKVFQENILIMDRYKDLTNHLANYIDIKEIVDYGVLKW